MDTTATFIEAIQQGNLAQVEQMLQNDSSLVNASTTNGVSAVLIAVYYGEPAIADLLIKQGASLDIFGAAATGQLDRLKTLIEQNPSLVNAIAPDGFQPLGLASFFGHLQAAKLLLAHGAEVNSPSNNAQKVQPLHSAVANQHLEIAKMLLEHGADVNAVQQDGYTPLHEAAQNGQIEMVKLLLSYHANKVPQLSDGQTPLNLAVQKGHQEIADLLR